MRSVVGMAMLLISLVSSLALAGTVYNSKTGAQEEIQSVEVRSFVTKTDPDVVVQVKGILGASCDIPVATLSDALKAAETLKKSGNNVSCTLGTAYITVR